MKLSGIFSKKKRKLSLDQEKLEKLVELEDELSKGSISKKLIEEVTSLFIVSSQGNDRLLCSH